MAKAKKPARSKTHVVMVKITFDKPCSLTRARDLFADTIHDRHYCGMSHTEDEPEEFYIDSVRKPRTAGAAA